MNIVFMGTPLFAIPTLEALISANISVKAVVTQPDMPKGRGLHLTPPPVKVTALNNSIEVLQPENPNKDISFIKRLKEYKPDVIVVVAYGQILSEEILNLPVDGCINLHASLLPKYRGAAPINHAIINGETVTGITIIKMDKGMDTGDILLKRDISIEARDNASTMHDKLSMLGAKGIVDTLNLIKDRLLKPEPQIDNDASYAPRLKKVDGIINWNILARDISNRIRGLVPWPCAYTHINGKILKIWEAETADIELPCSPGEVIIQGRDKMFVGTKKGVLKINEIQMEGKKRMKVKDFIQGDILKSNEILGR